ncbi:MAG: DNA mismatch repair endonuclease MutL [Fibrobacterota bacterium]
MTSIKLLDNDIINKIAAGEVIERPASVVKELFENSIDGGASNVIIDAAGSGLRYISVSDDGKGMGRKDALLAFKRHATSKISSAGDLFSITTRGFRGEALASIAAVSKASLETASQIGSGTLITAFDGNIVEEDVCSRPRGTKVMVKDLFYNTPARLKFMKTGRTELRNMIETTNSLALANPGISVRFIHDGKEQINYPSVRGIEERASFIFGRKILRETMAVPSHFTGAIEVYGMVSKPQFARKTARSQYIFVNGRPVFSRNLAHAVKNAFGNLIPGDRYPFLIIFLNIPPEIVDVNVHPAKKEVRFTEEKMIYQAVYRAVKSALSGESDGLIPSENNIRTEKNGFIMSEDDSGNYEKENRGQPALRKLFERPDAQQSLFEEKNGKDEKSPGADSLELVNYFQLHNRYIMCQIQNGILVIDQHAAHERILYEQARDNIINSSGSSQRLLFPENIEFSRAEMIVFESNLNTFNSLGFDLKLFSGNTLVVEGIPAGLDITESSDVISAMLDYLLNSGRADDDFRDKFAKAYACGAAVKFGMELNIEEMNSLVADLFKCDVPYTCPHGRPTMVRVTLEELARRFLRQ